MPFSKTPPNHTGQFKGDAPPPHPGASCLFNIVLAGLVFAVLGILGYGLYMVWPLLFQSPP